MRVIVIFLFKIPYKILKGLIKKVFTYPNTLITVYFHSYHNEIPFNPSKNITKQANKSFLVGNPSYKHHLNEWELLSSRVKVPFKPHGSS